MLFGTNKMRLTFLSMLIVVLGLTDCTQSENAKLEQSRQFEKKALELRLKKDFRGALREQLKAVELNGDAQGLTILAGIYQEINETENVPEYFQKSKEVLKKAVKLDPNDAVAHSMLADVLSQTEDNQGAVEEQREAVRLDPNNARYYSNLGTYYGLLEDRKSEREQYEKALKIDINYPQAVYNLAILEKEEGNYDRAIELLKRSVNLYTGDEKSINRAMNKITEIENLRTRIKKN